ncbi:hypothetical protein MN032_17730 [Agromyces atrinae]|uniref:hypothetical protein n=1 Tax=Agromyces atrinae TaxID=592376 RepID=UPI001F57DBEC|nr:hypothetical protein [Agromyces atrinae]MCI2959529.1 hypothetical protein [Agromyces atrinae]
MPWFKVDDGFHGHPKVVELDLAAVGLWTLAGSWCMKYLTDGRITAKTVARLGGSDVLIAQLVDANLWCSTPGDEQYDYLFNDWSSYQPLKEAVEAERAAAQERMKRVRAARTGSVRANADRTEGARSPERSGEPRENFDGTSGEVRSAPSHPIPTRPEESIRTPSVHDYSTEFELWWAEYPRKQAKPDAFKAFKAARKTVELEVLIAGVRAYKLLTIGQEKGYLKLPAGWLRDRRWEDEHVAAPVADSPRPMPPPAVAPVAVRECATHAGYPVPCLRCAEQGGAR